MTNYIGPKQRPIIEAMKGCAELMQNAGCWRIRHDQGRSYLVNKERCMALYVRGFIMADGQASNGSILYRLTEKGKRA